MRIYCISNELIPLSEESIFTKEEEVEDIIASNLGAVFPDEDRELLLLGRQVECDGRYIDVLAVDRKGNLVIIEIKYNKMNPREVIGQVLDYASCIENWDTDQLLKHSKTGITADKLREFLGIEAGEPIINRKQILVLLSNVEDEIAKRLIRYLRERGVPIYYILYRTFLDKQGNKYIAFETIVGEDVVPQRSKQVERYPSLKEHLSRLRDIGLKGLADIIEKYWEENPNKVRPRAHLRVYLLEDYVRIEINTNKTSPYVWFYVKPLPQDKLSKVVKVLESRGLKIDREKIKELTEEKVTEKSIASLKGAEGLRKLEEIIKDLLDWRK